MYLKAEKENLKKRINNNTHEIYILSIDEMDHIINNSTKSSLHKKTWQYHKNKIENTANYYSGAKDIVVFNKLLSDLGYAGARAYIKTYGGKKHIILKGHPGLRKILNGTKYGVKNTKVVKMGLGKYGGVQAAKSGGIITIFLLTGYRVVDYFMTDEATLSQLFGTLATDVMKIGVATGVSIAAATATAAAGSAMVASSSAAAAFMGGVVVAIGPLAAVIVVGIGVSYALNELDKHYNITEKVIAALDEIYEKGVYGIVSEKRDKLVRQGKSSLNDAADSVIDYAVEKAEKIVIRAMRNILRNFTLPNL